MGIFKTIVHEVKYLKKVLRILKAVKHIDPASELLVPDEIESWVEKYAKNIALIEDDKTLTCQQMDDYANRVANWA